MGVSTMHQQDDKPSAVAEMCSVKKAVVIQSRWQTVPHCWAIKTF